MSLAELRKIGEDGVTFRSHIDGSAHLLTPELSIEIQRLLGSDITMAFDECTPYPDAARAVEPRWMPCAGPSARARAFVERPGHGIFGIVQGGVHPDLRAASRRGHRRSALTATRSAGWRSARGRRRPSHARRDRARTAGGRPRYLMGVGKPADLVGAVGRGIDMFDCVMPTRSGRTRRPSPGAGTLNLRNARHADDPAPLDPECRCPACTGYSRAYLHHLCRSRRNSRGDAVDRPQSALLRRLMAEMRERDRKWYVR